MAEDPAESPDAPDLPAAEPVRVSLDPTFEQEIGLEVSDYRDGGLQRIRVLPQTVVESEQITVELARGGALPDSVRIGAEEVALGPELATATLPPLPSSTVNRRLSVLGSPTVEVAAHIDGDGDGDGDGAGDDAVAAIEWRTDLDPEWRRVTGTSTTLGPFDDDEVVWVRAVTAAGFTESPAQRIGLTAPPAVTDVCAEVPPITFADGVGIAPVHLDNVTCMAAFGITVGVDDVPNFAPGRQVTRQEMATFIARLLRVATTGSTDLPDDAVGVDFTDVVGGNVHAPAIGWLASIGVTDGVAADRFAPGAPVTRQQMASFIARAQRYLGAFEEADVDAIVDADLRPSFADVSAAAAVHRPNIEVLRALEVVEGLASGGFGPGEPVTRQQMAAFVMRTAALLASLDRWDAGDADAGGADAGGDDTGGDDTGGDDAGGDDAGAPEDGDLVTAESQ